MVPPLRRPSLLLSRAREAVPARVRPEAAGRCHRQRDGTRPSTCRRHRFASRWPMHRSRRNDDLPGNDDRRGSKPRLHAWICELIVDASVRHDRSLGVPIPPVSSTARIRERNAISQISRAGQRVIRPELRLHAAKPWAFPAARYSGSVADSAELSPGVDLVPVGASRSANDLQTRPASSQRERCVDSVSEVNRHMIWFPGQRSQLALRAHGH